MTNAEMYKKVFGLDPDIMGCPTFHCENCPLEGTKPNCCGDVVCSWWEEEYKESEIENGKG